jgi:hypothetical protein
VKASVPKLFFCPGSASYTPVSQGSRWRVASRQLRKPTTSSALAFFVVVRAPLGFPFDCAVQNLITPFTPSLPTRPPSTQNTDPQTLSHAALPLANASRLPRSKAFQRRNKPKQTRAWAGNAKQTRESRSQPAGKGISAAEQAARFRIARPRQAAEKPLASGGSGAFQRRNKARASGSQGQDRLRASRSHSVDQGHFSDGKRRGLGLARPRQAAGKSFASGGSGAFQRRNKARASGSQRQFTGRGNACWGRSGAFQRREKLRAYGAEGQFRPTAGHKAEARKTDAGGGAAAIQGRGRAHQRRESPNSRKVDDSPSRPFSPPEGLMERQ